MVSSCASFVEDLDISPNSPVEVSPSLLLTTSEVATQVAYSGQLARFSTILNQQMAGTDFQLLDVADYTILEGNNVNEWELIYTDILVNCDILLDTYGPGNPYYSGMAKVTKALGLGLATDLWGDVPNREAGNGQDGRSAFNPVFDDQEVVISDIQELLTSAIADFGQDAAANAIIPGSDDIWFEGDVAKWTKVAWVLKARYAMRLSARDNNAASTALGFINNAGLTGTDDDMNGLYGTNGNEQNQWFAFQNARANYIKMGKPFVDLLESINDPRLAFYAGSDTSGGFSGASINTADDGRLVASDIGPYFGSVTSPSPLVTFVEGKFIEAEAKFRTGDLAGAAEAHNMAIIAHVEQVTAAAPPAAYVTSQASEDASTIDLGKILTHKYVALFTQVEAYNDWRRTGVPALTPNPNGSVNSIPVRLPTVLDERLYNTNAEVISDITTPVWWDN